VDPCHSLLLLLIVVDVDVEVDLPGASEPIRMDDGHMFSLPLTLALTLASTLSTHASASASASASAHTDSLAHAPTQLPQLQLDPRTPLPCGPQPNIVRYHLDVLPPFPVLPREERFEVVAIPENALCRGQIGEGGVVVFEISPAEDYVARRSGAGDDVCGFGGSSWARNKSCQRRGSRPRHGNEKRRAARRAPRRVGENAMYATEPQV
jgi:hypothetical protein